MLIQILSHTPVYVWVILAVLVYRGVVEMRDRDVDIRKLCIVPVIMLALTIQDIAAKFGVGVLPLSAWASGAVVMTVIVWKFSLAGLSAGASLGTVRVHGSKVPLTMMIAIFLTKYVTAVTLVIEPSAGQQAIFVTVVCALFGVFSGYFLGRLVCYFKSWQSLRGNEHEDGPVTATV